MFWCVRLFMNTLSCVIYSAVFSCSLIFSRLSHILLCSAAHQYSLIHHMFWCVQFMNILSCVIYSAVFSCSSIFSHLSHVLVCSVVHEYSVVCHIFCCVQLFINILSSVTYSAVFCSWIFCILSCSAVLSCSSFHTESSGNSYNIFFITIFNWTSLW